MYYRLAWEDAGYLRTVHAQCLLQQSKPQPAQERQRCQTIIWFRNNVKLHTAW